MCELVSSRLLRLRLRVEGDLDILATMLGIRHLDIALT